MVKKKMKIMIKKIIISNSFFIKLWFEYAYIRNRGKNFIKDIDDCVEKYVSNKNDLRYVKKVKRDIFFCKFRYLLDAEEYFLHNFEMLNHYGRNQYISTFELGMMYGKFNSNGTIRLLQDKKITYDYFKEYYGRELVKIENEVDYEKFVKFVKTHPKFVVKPIAGNQGNGMHIVNLLEDRLDENMLFKDCINLEGGVVLEELIIQAEEMAKFHPASINTIRFVTFFHNGILHKISAAIRIGRNGSCVDNACAGGIYASIDLDTGIIDSVATDFNLNRYMLHPDTNEKILGAQIPKWNELNEMIQEVVQVLPEMKYVGWDFAFSDKGWVIVEGNGQPGSRIIQIKGLRKRTKCMVDAYKELFIL